MGILRSNSGAGKPTRHAGRRLGEDAESDLLLLMRTVVAALCVAGWSVAAAAQTTTFKSDNRTTTIVEGVPRRIVVDVQSPSQDYVKVFGRGGGQGGGSCDGRAFPTFNLLKGPEHGQLCYRDENGVVRYVAGNPRQNCVGAEALFRTLYYRPSSGYVGRDDFRFEVKNSTPRVASLGSRPSTSPYPRRSRRGCRTARRRRLPPPAS